MAFAAAAERLAAFVSQAGRRTLAVFAILWRIIDRTLTDGFIHAGNLAYLSLVTLFPAAILIHAVTASLGRTDAGRKAMEGFLATLPREVGELVAPIVDEVVTARSGPALLVGAAIALWTTSSFVGTLSDLLRRAHGTLPDHPFWLQRLFTLAITMAATLLILVAFLGQTIVDALIGTVTPYAPRLAGLVSLLDISKLSGIVAIFLVLWALFRILTPRAVRRSDAPLWPGPLLVTLVWAGTTAMFGPLMADAANFSLTYGAFTGTMLALGFFYIVGFALVAGAETNAALASNAHVVERIAAWRRLAARHAPGAGANEQGDGHGTDDGETGPHHGGRQ